MNLFVGKGQNKSNAVIAENCSHNNSKDSGRESIIRGGSTEVAMEADCAEIDAEELDNIFSRALPRRIRDIPSGRVTQKWPIHAFSSTPSPTLNNIFKFIMSKSNYTFATNSKDRERDSQLRMGALRAQLDSLIHRHSRGEFHVHLKMHELTSVPYLDGEYGVKWKFRGVVNAKGKSLKLAQAQSQADTPKATSKWKGKEREVASTLWNTTSSAVNYSEGDLDRLIAGSSRNPSGSSMPGIFSTPLTASPTYSTTSLPSSSSSSGPSHAAGSSSSHSYVTPSMDSELDSPPSTSPTKKDTITPSTAHFHSHDRGMTSYKELREHKVIFDQTVDVIVQMYIDSQSSSSSATPNANTNSSTSKLPSPPPGPSTPSTRRTQPPMPIPTSGRSTPAPTAGKLLPSPLKLVIIQKVDPNDPGAPSNPRLGAVYLDLAEFADPSLGPITRKFLLAESRTNAILKVCICVLNLFVCAYFLTHIYS